MSRNQESSRSRSEKKGLSLSLRRRHVKQDTLGDRIGMIMPAFALLCVVVYAGITWGPQTVQTVKSSYEQWQTENELAEQQGSRCDGVFDVELINEETMFDDGKATFRFDPIDRYAWKGFYLAVYDGSQEIGEQKLLAKSTGEFAYHRGRMSTLGSSLATVELPAGDSCYYLHVVTGCGTAAHNLNGGDYFGNEYFRKAFNLKTAGCFVSTEDQKTSMAHWLN